MYQPLAAACGHSHGTSSSCASSLPATAARPHTHPHHRPAPPAPSSARASGLSHRRRPAGPPACSSSPRRVRGPGAGEALPLRDAARHPWSRRAGFLTPQAPPVPPQASPSPRSLGHEHGPSESPRRLAPGQGPRRVSPGPTWPRSLTRAFLHLLTRPLLPAPTRRGKAAPFLSISLTRALSHVAPDPLGPARPHLHLRLHPRPRSRRHTTRWCRPTHQPHPHPPNVPAGPPALAPRIPRPF